MNESRQQDLFESLWLRPLSSEELIEIGHYGTRLNIFMGVPYNAEEKLMELQAALLFQGLLQNEKRTRGTDNAQA